VAVADPLGGDIQPARAVEDPFPTFNGIAVDPQNNRVVMSDENRKSLLFYDRRAGGRSDQTTRPLSRILGPDSQVGFVVGVALDPQRREAYVVNGDTEDRLMVFPYGDRGDVKPLRLLYVPHQSWGLALNDSRDELAVSVEQLDMVAVYRREAKGLEAPLRIIRGPRTGMADAHGIAWDVPHHEIFVANHGNYAVITPYGAYDLPAANLREFSSGGHFHPPSITAYAETAHGNAAPLRTLQGARTELNWPMGMAVDSEHNEIAVANSGDDSILIFRRTADGNAAPVRVIRGPKTGLDGPVGVAFDTQHGELWAANFNAHTALVFSRTASGDVAPLRIIRNAPEGAATSGFGNPYACAYDSKRDELLVPN
jgi:DNA-binding beta-propeller fold protein YncE